MTGHIPSILTVLVRSLPPTPYFIINTVVANHRSQGQGHVSVQGTITSSSLIPCPRTDIASCLALLRTFSRLSSQVTAQVSHRARSDSQTLFIVMKIDFKWQNSPFASRFAHFTAFPSSRPRVSECWCWLRGHKMADRMSGPHFCHKVILQLIYCGYWEQSQKLVPRPSLLANGW